MPFDEPTGEAAGETEKEAVGEAVGVEVGRPLGRLLGNQQSGCDEDSGVRRMVVARAAYQRHQGAKKIQASLRC